jgi:hypothetical protein
VEDTDLRHSHFSIKVVDRFAIKSRCVACIPAFQFVYMGDTFKIALGDRELERYVILRWNDSQVAALDAKARCARLAREFVNLGGMGRFVSYIPGTATWISLAT